MLDGDEKRRTAVYRFPRILAAITFALTIATITTAQTKSFTPVEGASLKAKIDEFLPFGLIALFVTET